MPDGSFVMDSRKIADALEKHQPEPSMHLDSGYVDRAQEAVSKQLYGLVAIGMPRIPEQILNPASQGYFNETRAKRFGMSLPELAKSDRAGENAWKAAEPHMVDLKNMLHEHEDGPYVLGKTPSYADLIIAGWWRFLQLISQDGDLYGRMMKFDESFPKHHEACKKWLEKED